MTEKSIRVKNRKETKERIYSQNKQHGITHKNVNGYRGPLFTGKREQADRPNKKKI